MADDPRIPPPQAETKADAIAAWNRRADVKEKTDV